MTEAMSAKDLEDIHVCAARGDDAFARHARRHVNELLAEVGRLRIEVEELRAELAPARAFLEVME